MGNSRIDRRCRKPGARAVKRCVEKINAMRMGQCKIFFKSFGIFSEGFLILIVSIFNPDRMQDCS